MRWRRWLVAVLTVGFALRGSPPAVLACPFCSAVAPTFSQEFAAMDAVVIATFERMLAPHELPADFAGDSSTPDIPMARLAIHRVLKGEDALAGQKTIATVFFAEAKPGEAFLVMGVDPRQLSWSTPLRLNDRQQQYISQIVALPPEGPLRLAFFQEYLEDSDQMLARDAYDEFATTPYSVVKQLKPHLNRARLVAWIEDPQVSVSNRRLYLTLLGVCGGPEELPMLERRLQSTNPQSRSGLDALIACYLTLRGPEGVELIEKLYLTPQPDSTSETYANVYAAIMALRFHASEEVVIPRARVIQAFVSLLDHPAYADIVIPDLARWEDWSHLDRLVALFKSADVETSFVRLPIVAYVRACPRPEALQALDELKRVDPETVQRSFAFFPAPPPKTPPEPKEGLPK